jgi:hypothetical protein
VDLRRGLDLLVARNNVDAKRIGFVGHSFGAQCGNILDAVDTTHDEFVPIAQARHYFELSSGPKEMKLYDSTHALNAGARDDRYEFLRKRLGLPELPSRTLEKVPPTK